MKIIEEIPDRPDSEPKAASRRIRTEFKPGQLLISRRQGLCTYIKTVGKPNSQNVYCSVDFFHDEFAENEDTKPIPKVELRISSTPELFDQAIKRLQDHANMPRLASMEEAGKLLLSGNVLEIAELACALNALKKKGANRSPFDWVVKTHAAAILFIADDITAYMVRTKREHKARKGDLPSKRRAQSLDRARKYFNEISGRLLAILAGELNGVTFESLLNENFVKPSFKPAAKTLHRRRPAASEKKSVITGASSIPDTASPISEPLSLAIIKPQQRVSEKGFNDSLSPVKEIEGPTLATVFPGSTKPFKGNSLSPANETPTKIIQALPRGRRREILLELKRRPKQVPREKMSPFDRRGPKN